MATKKRAPAKPRAAAAERPEAAAEQPEAPAPPPPPPPPAPAPAAPRQAPANREDEEEDSPKTSDPPAGANGRTQQPSDAGSTRGGPRDVAHEARVSAPRMTKYEFCSLLCTRFQNLMDGAPSALPDAETESMTPFRIALEEIERRKVPLLLVRHMPNGDRETWNVAELDLPHSILTHARSMEIMQNTL